MIVIDGREAERGEQRARSIEHGLGGNDPCSLPSLWNFAVEVVSEQVSPSVAARGVWVAVEGRGKPSYRPTRQSHAYPKTRRHAELDGSWMVHGLLVVPLLLLQLRMRVTLENPLKESGVQVLGTLLALISREAWGVR